MALATPWTFKLENWHISENKVFVKVTICRATQTQIIPTTTERPR